MGDAFKNHVFPKYEKSRAMKPQMKGLEDPTLNSFSLLDLSALMKPELKDQMSKTSSSAHSSMLPRC